MHSESSSTNVAIRNIRQEDTLVDGLLNGYQFNSNISENSLMAENKERESLNPTRALEGSHKKSSIGENDEFIEASRYLLLRLLHSIFSGLNYGMALMLMLVAMTFNPSLFLALVIGYSIGDFVFFVKMRPQSSMSDCH